MKLNWRLSGFGLVTACGSLFAGLVLAGCATTEQPVFHSTPGFTAVESPATAAGAAPPAPLGTNTAPAGLLSTTESDRFAIRDQVIVTFSGHSDPLLQQPHDERIKEDGTITLPYINAVKAAGKTPGQLQTEIHNLYVPQYFVRLTVTVKSQERAYFVGGEVRNPNRYLYAGDMTVTKAIQSAGDFTDFANKKAVLLTRADGKTITVNCKRAMERPELDPKVLPGDKITVKRRWW